MMTRAIQVKTFALCNKKKVRMFQHALNQTFIVP